MANSTYVYCVVASSGSPRRTRAARGLPGTGPVRLLDAGDGLYLIVADAPSRQYGEAAINRGLANLEWVSRAAVAHEAVVESFNGATAILPVKLFTIFTSDARALAHVRGQRQRLATLVRRVGKHDEWSIRIVLDRGHAQPVVRQSTAPGRGPAGVAYLTRKKAKRDASAELAERARETVADLFERLASRTRLAKRRGASELPVEDGPLLLDAAFLVPRSQTTAFRRRVAREARALARHGYGVTLTGPWPPYSFVQD